MLLFSLVVFLTALAIYLKLDAVKDEGRPGEGRSEWRWLLILLARSIVAGAVTGWLSCDWLVSAVAGTCSVALPCLRRFLVPQVYGAELEIFGTGAILSALYASTVARGLLLQRYAPASIASSRLIAVLLIASILLALLRGGTFVIRAILKRTESLPRTGVERSLDETEINRGRIIGNLERIILTIVVAKGSYEALGFLIAAKGLIRSEHFNNRDWAEYFLIGSLASVLIALVAGWTVGIILKAYWI